jgi:nucleoside-diphosphate-sugar epimerase
VAGPPVVLPNSGEDMYYSLHAIWDVYTGKPLNETGFHGHDAYVDVRDIARLTLFGLEHPDTVDGERFLAAAGWAPPQAIADILRDKYPGRARIIERGNPTEGYAPGFGFLSDGLAFDGTKAVRVTGMQYLPVEKTVIDTIDRLQALVHA